MSRVIRRWREDMRRVDPLQPAVRSTLPTVSGTLVPPQGVDGTSSPTHGHERPGDGESPGAGQEEDHPGAAGRAPGTAAPRRPGSVEPAAVDPTGSPMKWVGEQVAGQGGWYRGARLSTATSSLRLEQQDEAMPPTMTVVVPARPPAGRPARPRARGARALARAPDLREVAWPATASGRRWTFYEGPPTANGMPGTHHIEARVFKDVFPRFRTMQGYHVDRKAGWDCHGLPVELAVEKELGFSGKPDIEAYGIAEFNARCRESVLRHVDALRADDRADGLLGRHATTPTGPWTRTTSSRCGGR